ncbi:MAG: peptidase MA family metallohydrolase [Candidatus Omnitrophota bacterium]
MKKAIVMAVAILWSATASLRVDAQTKEYKELRSDHFVILYAPQAETIVYKIKDDAEYFYRKIVQEFGLTRAALWAWSNRAQIVIAKDKETYVRAFGCPEWSGACVDYYNRIMYTFPGQENFSRILSHELTHIIFREYVGYNRLPLWLDEGMAQYIEYRDSLNEQSAVSLMKQLIPGNRYLKFSDINGIYTLGNNTDVGLFYAQAFCMVYFLIKRFSREDFSEFLSYLKDGNSLDDALRKSFNGIDGMAQFEESWRRFYLL